LRVLKSNRSGQGHFMSGSAKMLYRKWCKEKAVDKIKKNGEYDHFQEQHA